MVDDWRVTVWVCSAAQVAFCNSKIRISQADLSNFHLGKITSKCRRYKKEISDILNVLKELSKKCFLSSFHIICKYT